MSSLRIQKWEIKISVLKHKSVINIKVKGKMRLEQSTENTENLKGGDLKEAIKRDSQKANLVKMTAEIMKCSPDLVYKVLAGTRINDQIFTCYMELLQGESALLKAVKKLVPFNI